MIRIGVVFTAMALTAGASSLVFGQQESVSDARLAARSDSAFQQGGFRFAADGYRQLVARDQRNDVAWYRLGLSLERLGKSADAIDAYSHAAMFPSQTMFAELALARVFGQTNATDSAVAHLRAAAGAGVDPVILDQSPAFAQLRALPQFTDIRRLAEEKRYPCRNVHTFDFWVGDFDAFQWYQTAPNAGGQLHNTREYDGCAIIEHWMPTPGRGPAGLSLAFYDTSRRVWRFIWIDDANGSIEFDGDYRDGAMRFEGAFINPDGTKALARNVLQNVSADTIRHTFSVSTDNGKTWAVKNEDRFVRRQAIPGHAGTQTSNPPRLAPDARDTMTSFAVGGRGLSMSDRDPATRPGDDFYRSQNGAWLDATAKLGIDRNNSYWRDLMRLPARRVASLLSAVADNRSAPPSSPEAKAGAFYRAFMDTARIHAKGLDALAPALDRVRAARSLSDMAQVMGEEAGAWTPRPQSALVQTFPLALFSLAIAQDPNAPGQSAVFVNAAGLLLPAPSYYTDPKQADIRAAYIDYIARMLRLLHWDSPEQCAQQVLALETRLAAVSWSPEQLRDASKLINPIDLSELKRFAPNFDWAAFMKGAGLASTKRVIIDTKSAFPELAKIFADTPLEVWQARQAFAIADQDAPKLSEEAAAAALEFRARRFNGSAASQPREFRILLAVDASIPGIVGELYARRYYPPNARALAREMANNIREAFDAKLASSTVLSAESKRRARAKLAAMRLDVGAPDQIPDYSGLAISDTGYFDNLVRAREFEWNRERARAGKPLDRTTWVLRPYDANYAYAPNTNSMVITAGALEPPFFDLTADPAINYGAIGTLMASQMAAAFDDNGRHFGGNGGFREILTGGDGPRFDSLKQALSAEYSKVEPIPGFPVHGDLVVNEAIDDVVGIQVALDAYHRSLRGQSAKTLDGFTGDQRFFLGRAQMWRAAFVPAFYRVQSATGRNAPPFQRVNGPIRHIDAWYQAFGVSPGDKMYVEPNKRVRFLF